MSIHANINAAQYATLERIMEFVANFKELDFNEFPNLKDSMTLAKKSLETVR